MISGGRADQPPHGGLYSWRADAPIAPSSGEPIRVLTLKQRLLVNTIATTLGIGAYLAVALILLLIFGTLPFAIFALLVFPLASPVIWILWPFVCRRLYPSYYPGSSQTASFGG